MRTASQKILFVYRAPKKLVLLSEVTEFGFGTLSLPKEGCLLKIEIKRQNFYQ